MGLGTTILFLVMIIVLALFNKKIAGWIGLDNIKRKEWSTRIFTTVVGLGILTIFYWVVILVGSL